AGIFNQKIIGGHKAKYHSKPYMASLQLQSGHHFCGGFLVQEDWVMTAAHCFDQIHPSNATVVLGAHVLQENEYARQRFQILEAHMNPGYNNATLESDVMLLRLDRAASLTWNVQTIPLPQQNAEVQPGTACTIAGWGDVNNKKSRPSSLQELKVIIWDHCDSKDLICAGLQGKKRGICKGDSGSPLVCNGVAHGIASFILQSCGNGQFPDYYTKILVYRDWIKSVMDMSIP
uniref:Peptidase S1 domain-containing protein n=2 Tax=Latimeria chalumnae TaxID=7897 RepID=H3AXZ6_LATCH